ncbi:MAG: hypothetical protein AABY32_01665 [Nanoarchaeota archaeon]
MEHEYKEIRQMWARKENGEFIKHADCRIRTWSHSYSISIAFPNEIVIPIPVEVTTIIKETRRKE